MYLNGEPRAVPDGCTVARLLADAGLDARRLAVEVNGAIVPRGAHATHLLCPGDRMEIVQALGGG